MLMKILDSGNQLDVQKLISQPSLVWINFFGFLGTGFTLGWFMRAVAYAWTTGAASAVIVVAVMLTIVSQIGLIIFLLLQLRNHLRIKSLPNPTL
jgi:hypothetical protein